MQRNEFWRLKDHDGKPPGVMGWWPSRTTTFIENHDTGSTQVPLPFGFLPSSKNNWCVALGMDQVAEGRKPVSRNPVHLFRFPATRVCALSASCCTAFKLAHGHMLTCRAIGASQSMPLSRVTSTS